MIKNNNYNHITIFLEFVRNIEKPDEYLNSKDVFKKMKTILSNANYKASKNIDFTGEISQLICHFDQLDKKVFPNLFEKNDTILATAIDLRTKNQI